MMIVRTYLLLDEVKQYVEGAIDSLNNQKKHYSYEEVVALESKAQKKYSALYKKKAFRPSAFSLEGRRITSLHSKYIILNYLKIIMETLGVDNTEEIKDVDLDDLSLKIFEKTDTLGYSKYIESKNKR